MIRPVFLVVLLEVVEQEEEEEAASVAVSAVERRVELREAEGVMLAKTRLMRPVRRQRHLDVILALNRAVILLVVRIHSRILPRHPCPGRSP